jgi:hypothetical protein
VRGISPLAAVLNFNNENKYHFFWLLDNRIWNQLWGGRAEEVDCNLRLRLWQWWWRPAAAGAGYGWWQQRLLGQAHGFGDSGRRGNHLCVPCHCKARIVILPLPKEKNHPRTTQKHCNDGNSSAVISRSDLTATTSEVLPRQPRTSVHHQRPPETLYTSNLVGGAHWRLQTPVCH